MPWLLLCLPENDDKAIRVGRKDGIHDIVISMPKPLDGQVLLLVRILEESL